MIRVVLSEGREGTYQREAIIVDRLDGRRVYLCAKQVMSDWNDKRPPINLHNDVSFSLSMNDLVLIGAALTGVYEEMP